MPAHALMLLEAETSINNYHLHFSLDLQLFPISMHERVVDLLFIQLSFQVKGLICIHLKEDLSFKTKRFVKKKTWCH